MVDKIVEGRLSKFYEEVCLLEQPFIKDNAMTVGELIKSKADGLGEIESGAVLCVTKLAKPRTLRERKHLRFQLPHKLK